MASQQILITTRELAVRSSQTICLFYHPSVRLDESGTFFHMDRKPQEEKIIQKKERKKEEVRRNTSSSRMMKLPHSSGQQLFMEQEEEVSTPHSFTSRMCAATRYYESIRNHLHDDPNQQPLFEDPAAYALAGPNGLQQPMGDWIVVPRTKFGDDFLCRAYVRDNIRQAVLLGAGMDGRAYRTYDYRDSPTKLTLSQLHVFEVDQPTTFQVKEPILTDLDLPLTVASRSIIPHDFNDNDNASSKISSDGNTLDQVGPGHRPKVLSWTRKLVNAGFDPTKPSVWLLEGLVYYLEDDAVIQMMDSINQMTANVGSCVFHDSVSHQYRYAGVRPGGAPFVSGSDDYATLWNRWGNFNRCTVHDFETIQVDRSSKTLRIQNNNVLKTMDGYVISSAPPEKCRGNRKVLFVEAYKR